MLKTMVLIPALYSYVMSVWGQEINPKKCFGSNKATRVIHVELNYVCIDIGKKESCPNLDRRPAPG
jgi:hypothetical protein